MTGKNLCCAWLFCLRYWEKACRKAGEGLNVHAAVLGIRELLCVFSDSVFASSGSESVLSPCSSLVLSELRSPSGSVSPWLSPAALCGLAEGKAALVMFKISSELLRAVRAALQTRSRFLAAVSLPPGPARSLLAGRRWLPRDRPDPLSRVCIGTGFGSVGGGSDVGAAEVPSPSLPGSDGGARTAAAAPALLRRGCLSC